MKTPNLSEEKPSALDKLRPNLTEDMFSDFTPRAANVATPQKKFTGTDNPRELRAIHALMTRPMPREHLDRFVGCSNSPDVVFRLRQKGLEIPCEKVPDTDRDGLLIRRGVFSFTAIDCKKIKHWKASRQKGLIDLTLVAWLGFAGMCTLMLMGEM